MCKELAPILLFCYKRLEELEATVTALQSNYLACESDLIIFSDGAKSPADEKSVRLVRDYVNTITGFKTIQVYEANTNLGLANSIISGVTKLFEIFDKVIVLEDDLITSKNFLSFMNQALHYYKNKNVFSIAGFSFPIKGLPENSVYFTMRASSWGWATWKDRWECVDWEVNDYHIFKQNKRMRKNFNKMGSDLSKMLDRQMVGKIDSWAIRWCYHQFKTQSYTVHPAVSKVQNAGFSKEATHTNELNGRYSTILDQFGRTCFDFAGQIELDQQLLEQVVKHYSLSRRVYFKMLNLFLNR